MDISSTLTNVEVSLYQLPYVHPSFGFDPFLKKDSRFHLKIVGSSDNAKLNEIKAVYNEFASAKEDFAQQKALLEIYYSKIEAEKSMQKGIIKPFMKMIGKPTEENQKLLQEIGELADRIDILTPSGNDEYESLCDVAKRELVKLEHSYIASRNPHEILTDLLGGENEFSKLPQITFNRPFPASIVPAVEHAIKELTAPIMRATDAELGEDFLVIRCKKTDASGNHFLLFIHEKDNSAFSNMTKSRPLGFTPVSVGYVDRIDCYREVLQDASEDVLSRLAELILMKKNQSPIQYGDPFEFVID